MSIKKINGGSLSSWVETLIKKNRIYGIQAKDDKFAFDVLNKAENLRLDYDVSILPPKKYFLPSTEELLTFDENGFKSTIDTEQFILFGVHPYDMHAINQMDEIFSDVNSDIHYFKRRENATIVVCDVENESENVFAGCMGYAVVDDGFDILITKTGSDYVIDSRTNKGETLLKDLSNSQDADQASLDQRKSLWEKNKNSLKKHVLKTQPEKLKEILNNASDNPVWAERAELCFSCGSCNLVCPTCYCFNVQDDINFDITSGTRTRKWDGCMLKDFATVADGHNFRKEKADRFKHRYYRKAKYLPEKFGKIACVGCGRCISACVAKIANPVEVFNILTEGN